MPLDARIYVAGHRGLVGSAIVRALKHRGYRNILTRTRQELDLTDRRAVDAFFAAQRPEYIYVAAARVGGIWANNTYPVDFLQTNLEIELNVIRAAHDHQVKKLLFLGSSCIYPRVAPQPIKEEYLLTGLLEPTNQPYAIAKIAGIELVNAYRRQYGDRFISAMPTNLYGPGDNFDLETSHVLAALLRKTHEAKVSGSPAVEVWGTGEPRREFLHVDDLAEACLFLMDRYDDAIPINVGVGEDVSIRELAELIGRVVGYQGDLAFDATKPDGMPRKLLDVSRIHRLGWRARIPLEEGIRHTYQWFLANATARPGPSA
ncbi:GDP-L-fucose synthase [Limnochorda pilosa]|uniref:GDP-L-fucose synthase n=1 Tax=Limnochorda pilosa TaxID=1555112 RepID=A0A0K2SLV9_LIMPI|nr:GDP-L-fucose synthase [Limnochorda pilosa]